MKLKTPEPIQVLIEGINVKHLFNENFVKLLENKWPDLKYQHFCLYIQNGEEYNNEDYTGERIFIGHKTPEEEEKNILLIDTNKPDTLNEIIKILEEL